jgi:hypothetical protein
MKKLYYFTPLINSKGANQAIKRDKISKYSKKFEICSVECT